MPSNRWCGVPRAPDPLKDRNALCKVRVSVHLRMDHYLSNTSQNQPTTPMRYLILLSALSLLFSTASAQTKPTTAKPGQTAKPTQSTATRPSSADAEYFAKLRADAYVSALSLNESQAAALHKIFLEGEKRVASQRAACRAAQEKVATTMKAYDEKALTQLSDEQQKVLAQLKDTGKFDPEIPSCSSAGKSCASSAGAHGCCAGGKMKDPKAEQAAPIAPEQNK